MSPGTFTNTLWESNIAMENSRNFLKYRCFFLFFEEFLLFIYIYISDFQLPCLSRLTTVQILLPLPSSDSSHDNHDTIAGAYHPPSAHEDVCLLVNRYGSDGVNDIYVIVYDYM